MCVCVCLRESLQVVVVQRGPVFVVAINKASLFVRVCRADGEALKGQRISSQLAPLPGVVTTNQEGFELVMPDFCAFSQPGTSISTDRNSRAPSAVPVWAPPFPTSAQFAFLKFAFLSGNGHSGSRTFGIGSNGLPKRVLLPLWDL